MISFYEDPLYQEAVRSVVVAQRCSVAFVQRILKIGFNRAAVLIERMERDGVVSEIDESGIRRVLVTDFSFEPEDCLDTIGTEGGLTNTCLDVDDEFSNVSFSQVAILDDGSAVVKDLKAVSYALLSWWKGDGGDDILSVSDDACKSELRFEYRLNLNDKHINENVLCIFEADEDLMLLSLYLYPRHLGGIALSRVNDFLREIMEVNLSLSYGALELVCDEVGSYHVRLKASTCLRGVKVGKVAIVSSMFSLAVQSMESAVSSTKELM